ncbi:trihelix transcription factor GTL1-like isoform X1 [Miscanthus floridulus]|uniref:trihelix transcription factor GTL1-like isoform X1 n=1 Tax=Miscanthus floridulus TaxID=154761 RepID=UPI00345A0ABE
MQQQHGGGGGGGGGGASGGGPAQQFGAQQVEMPPPFSPAGGAGKRISLAEAPSPISSRPPASSAPAQQYDELGASGPGAVGFDAEGLAAAAAGEEGASGGSAGNRWPRQETLELLKIRSDMDAAFRDATLKGPLWEQVSRKLAEKGYNRSAKKCKEKFENVHKYYKRTKESRAGRNDGKTYRFFTQLEALHGTGVAPASVASQVHPAISGGVSGAAGPSAVRVPAEPPPAVSAAGVGMPMTTTVGYPSFSTSNTEDYTDEDDSDDEGTEELVGGGADERGKRKRVSEGGGASTAGGGSGKMMRFFEGLMKQVMERQEAMQQRFLEAIEKREQDRMIREEAWRRQEMTRLAREQEILAQERAMAASRDAAVLSFIQKITGQTIPMPSIAAPTINAMPPPPSHPKPPPPQPHPTPIASASPAPPPPQPPASHTPPPQQQQQPSLQQQKPPLPASATQAPAPQQQSTDIVMTPAETTPRADTPVHEGSSGGATSSRWPKAEVHALIQLRSDLDTRYQEAGPKGPLWEEISAGMRRMGYNRNAKRCKEKWENINKYFKKVKETNKKRPEDSKTCPYFHQLDALYRNKAALRSSSGAGAAVHANASSAPPQETVTVVTAAAPISQTPPPPPPTQPSQSHHATKNGGTASNAAGTGTGNGNGGGASEHGSRGMQTQTSNGSVAASRFLGEGGGAASAAKKPGDIMEEMMEQRQPQQQAVVSGYNRIDGADSDNMDEDDYDEDDDDEDGDGNKMQYKIQFQHQQQHHQQQQHPNAGAGGGNQPGTAAPSTAAAPTTTAGSFLGMVQ